MMIQALRMSFKLSAREINFSKKKKVLARLAQNFYRCDDFKISLVE